MERVRRVRQIEKALGNKPIVAIGPRGSDFIGLQSFDLDFAGCFSLTDLLVSNSAINPDYFQTLELYTGRRRQSREFDQDTSMKAAELRYLRNMLECFRAIDPLVISYSATEYLETVLLKSNVKLLGNGFEHARQFNSKPQIERDLSAMGLPVIPWKVISSSDEVNNLLDVNESVVVRPQDGSSGIGILLFNAGDYSEESARIINHMIRPHNAIVSAAQFFPNAISLNMSGVVFQPSSSRKKCHISRFPVSAQLIGTPILTDLPFGYCGNDFSFGRSLDDNILNQCDDIMVRVGEYLASKKYVGAFGVDFLLTENGQVLFTEINPRFQGSTRLLTKICSKSKMTDVLLEHISACLGLSPVVTMNAKQWAEAGITTYSQMYVHNNTNFDLILPDSNRKNNQDAIEVDGIGNVPVTQHIMRELRQDGIVFGPGATIERVIRRGPVIVDDGKTLTTMASVYAGQIFDDLQPVQVISPQGLTNECM